VKLGFLFGFLAVAAVAQEYVRVSPRDARYLELSSGQPYIPIGLNMIGGPDVETFETWLRALADNRGNYIRVWLSNPLWDVESKQSGVYDEEKARRIDAMLALCGQLGIRVKLTMEHFRSVGGGRQAWADKPLHNSANGGTARDIADFFNGEASRALFVRKIAWYRERYGNRPVVYGWELWNEVDAVNRAMQPDGPDVLKWTETMLGELHRAFPKNMALQSLGSFDNVKKREIYRRHSLMPGNDLAQVHRYLDLGAAWEICHQPVDLLAADAVRELLRMQPGKPVILAESGAVEPNHSGPFKLYAKDPEGTLLHDVLFAPFFAGAAGPGQIWHWDAYVAKNNLWHHFARFAEAVKDLDAPAEKLEPSMVDHPQVRIYVLSGRTQTLMWLRDKQNNWMTELRDGVAPRTLKGIRIAVPGAEARVYDPWTDAWTKVQADQGQVVLPAFSRSLVVRIP
jgi:hypothetical protein